MFGFIKKIRGLVAFLKLIKDPTKTEAVFSLSNQLRKGESPLLQPTLEFILSLPGVQDLYDTRYEVPLPSVDELLQYPEGTLGKEFALHMQRNGLEIDFFPVDKGPSQQEFIVNRVRKMHDLWHVITGFDISVAGEVGLQAFTLAQLRSPFSALIMSGGVLHALTYSPRIFQDVIAAMFKGYQMGSTCRPLLGVRLEELLKQDLASLRNQVLAIHASQGVVR